MTDVGFLHKLKQKANEGLACFGERLYLALAPPWVNTAVSHSSRCHVMFVLEPDWEQHTVCRQPEARGIRES